MPFTTIRNYFRKSTKGKKQAHLQVSEDIKDSLITKTVEHMFKEADKSDEEIRKLSIDHKLLIASLVLLGNDLVKQQNFMNLIKQMAKPRVAFD